MNETQTFTPLADRILVDVQVEDELTVGGIIIPDNAREKPQRGTVIAVGPGSRDDKGAQIPIGVEVGETVLFSKYGGTEIKLGADEYLILRESDVLGVLR